MLNRVYTGRSFIDALCTARWFKSIQTRCSIVAFFFQEKAWNLGIKTNPALAFGVSPNSYFTDGTNNKEENDLWKQKHMHCFVWEKKPGTFKVSSKVQDLERYSEPNKTTMLETCHLKVTTNDVYDSNWLKKENSPANIIYKNA